MGGVVDVNMPYILIDKIYTEQCLFFTLSIMQSVEVPGMYVLFYGPSLAIIRIQG
jgi:hypothetical protein